MSNGKLFLIASCLIIFISLWKDANDKGNED